VVGYCKTLVMLVEVFSSEFVKEVLLRVLLECLHMVKDCGTVAGADKRPAAAAVAAHATSRK